MKKHIVYISLCLLGGLTLNSCKNDLKVLAPGEESVSVYGILNPNESLQEVRINKVFVTEGDVLEAAKDANQINYGAGELLVSLQRFLTGSSTPTLTTVGDPSKKEIVLTETVVTTAGGTFNQSQRIWQTTDKLYAKGEYKLNIKILKTGKDIYSQNLIIDSVKPSTFSSSPFRYIPLFFPLHGQYTSNTPQAGYIDYSNLNSGQRIRFKSIVNAKLYDVVMRFHYKDISLTDDTTFQYADHNFPTVKSSNLTGGEDLEVGFSANDFYINLANEVPKNPSSNLKHRIVHYVEYIIYAGAESLDTFLQVNAPSNTIAQDKPNYSNINGGIGVFSSRSTSAITHDFSNSTSDQLSCHSATKSLRFINSNGDICQ